MLFIQDQFAKMLRDHPVLEDTRPEVRELMAAAHRHGMVAAIGLMLDPPRVKRDGQIVKLLPSQVAEEIVQEDQTRPVFDRYIPETMPETEVFRFSPIASQNTIKDVIEEWLEDNDAIKISDSQHRCRDENGDIMLQYTLQWRPAK